MTIEAPGRLSLKQSLSFAVIAVLLVGLGIFLGSSRQAQVVVGALPPLPQANGALTPSQQAVVDLRSRAAMQFVFFHELGHMVIHQLKLPAIGPEEDVADEFAAYTLTDVLRAAPDDQKDFYSEIVYSGALFWRISGAIQQAHEGHRADAGITWYDEHAPDLRRYYNVLCIAVGADPLRFAGKAAIEGVPQSRLNRCDEEYKTKHAAWDTLLKPHTGGLWHRTFGARRLMLEVGPVGKTEWQPFETTYTQGNYFQQVLDGISRAVILPQTIPVVVKSCSGVSNAWWSPTEKRITLCHEFFQDVTNTFALAVLAGQGQAGERAQAAPPVPPAPAGPPSSPAPPAPSAPRGSEPDPLVPAGAIPSDTYTEPSGRFSVTVPPGWKAVPSGADGVSLQRGSTYSQVLIGPDGRAPQAVVTGLLQQIARQWSQLRAGSSQALTLGGSPGFYQMASGLNPKGVPSRVYVAAAPLTEGTVIVLVTSVPDAEFEQNKEALALIQLSLRVRNDAGAGQ